VKEACEYVGDNCRYYEALTTKKGKSMSMSDWLNMVTKRVPQLQNMLVAQGTSLRRDLLSMLNESQLTDWDIITERDMGIISFRNGYFDLSKRDDRAQLRPRFVLNDGQEDHKIAPVHHDLAFPDASEYQGLTLQELRQKCPVFDAVLSDQPELSQVVGDLVVDGRGGPPKRFSGLEIFLFCLMRACLPFNDGLKFMPWIVGDTGAGKTEIFHFLLQLFLGRPYVQVLQDGRHGDKFVINERLLNMALVIFSDTRGEPLTAEQLVKLVNHEAMATRGMREEAGDADASANAIAFTNIRPPWKDEGGAVVGRLMVIELEAVSNPDATVPQRLEREIPWILLVLLDAYRRVARHVLPTPYKQWQHPLFCASRQEQESVHPLADLLINHLDEPIRAPDGTTYTVTTEAAPVGKVPLAKLQLAIDAHCGGSSGVRIDRRGDEADCRSILGRVGNLLGLDEDTKLVLMWRVKVWKCLQCEQVTCIGGETVSDGWGCEHCDAGCRQATLTKMTTKKLSTPYVRNLRVRSEEASMQEFFEGGMPNGGRGAGGKAKEAKTYTGDPTVPFTPAWSAARWGDRVTGRDSVPTYDVACAADDSTVRQKGVGCPVSGLCNPCKWMRDHGGCPVSHPASITTAERAGISSFVGN
jgi:hypothetical protein